jgi:hypothetical protein
MDVPWKESRAKKRAGVVENRKVFDHAGLLVNGSPSTAEVPFI